MTLRYPVRIYTESRHRTATHGIPLFNSEGSVWSERENFHPSQDSCRPQARVYVPQCVGTRFLVRTQCIPYVSVDGFHVIARGSRKRDHDPLKRHLQTLLLLGLYPLRFIRLDYIPCFAILATHSPASQGAVYVHICMYSACRCAALDPTGWR